MTQTAQISQTGAGRSQPLNWRDWFIVLIVTTLMAVPGFVAIPPLDRSEAAIAIASQQVAQQGTIFESAAGMPIALHWAQAISALIAGADTASIVAYRMPSFLSALLASLIIAWLGAHLFNRRVGRIAGIVVGASLGLGMIARIATNDAMMFSGNLLAMAALARLYFRTTETWHAPVAPFVFWLGLMGSMMVKGTQGLIVPLLTMVSLMAMDRSLLRFHALFSLKVLLMPAFLLLAHLSPFLVGGADWQLWVSRLSTAFTGQHILFGILFLWPMSFVALLGLPLYWTQRKDRRFRFLGMWLVPALILFELAPHAGGMAALPLLGSVILAGAAGFTQLVDDRPSRFHRWPHYLGIASAVMTAIIGIVLGFYPVWAANNLPGGLNIIANPALGLVLVGGAAILAYTTWRGYQDWSGPRTMATMLGSSFVLLGLGFGSLLPALSPLWISERAARLISTHTPRTCESAHVIVAGFDEPSLHYALGSTITIGSAAAAAAHIQQDNKCHLALINADISTDFYVALGDQALQAEPLGAIAGFNYAARHDVSLGLFRLTPFYQQPRIVPQLPSTPVPDAETAPDEIPAEEPASEPITPLI